MAGHHLQRKYILARSITGIHKPILIVMAVHIIANVDSPTSHLLDSWAAIVLMRKSLCRMNVITRKTA